MTPGNRRAGAASGDVLLLLAALTFVGALAYPRLANRALNTRIATAQARVEAVRAAALRHRDQAGAWPDRQSDGQQPPEIRRYLPPGFSFQGDDHALTWERFEQVVAADTSGIPPVVDIPTASENPEAVTPAVPDSTAVSRPTVDTLAAIAVRSSDARILAALLDHFGPASSFIRGESWTLVLPKTGEGS